MRIKLLTLAFCPSLGGFDDRPLDGFLADKEVLAVREHFFVVHEQPYVACLVSWQPACPGTSREPGRRASERRPAREDPVQSLPAEARALFETLRQWRADRARSDGVPPYIVFTNRELAAIAGARPTSRNALLHVEGVGPGKVERYGADLLKRIPPGSRTTGPPTPEGAATTDAEPGDP